MYAHAVCSYKANTASVETIVVDDDTGEEKKRLINRMRWKGFGPVSISNTEKNVILTYVIECMRSLV